MRAAREDCSDRAPSNSDERAQYVAVKLNEVSKEVNDQASSLNIHSDHVFDQFAVPLISTRSQRRVGMKSTSLAASRLDKFTSGRSFDDYDPIMEGSFYKPITIYRKSAYSAFSTQPTKTGTLLCEMGASLKTVSSSSTALRIGILSSASLSLSRILAA